MVKIIVEKQFKGSVQVQSSTKGSKFIIILDSNDIE